MAVQSLKPTIDALKKRYGEDKARIQKETTLLYEKANVNPSAGESVRQVRGVRSQKKEGIVASMRGRHCCLGNWQPVSGLWRPAVHYTLLHALVTIADCSQPGSACPLSSPLDTCTLPTPTHYQHPLSSNNARTLQAACPPWPPSPSSLACTTR